MPVSVSYAPLTYSGNGTSTAFSVTWPFYSGTLRVTKVASTGVETVQTISTHYTVTGGTDADGLPSTGTVTMLTAPASGEQIRIERVTPLTQTITLTAGGEFSPKVVMTGLDKLTLIAQEGGGGGPDGITGDVLQLDSSGAQDFWDGEGKPVRMSFLELTEASAPATPDSGYGRLYVKTDGDLYYKDDAGTETSISDAASSAATSAAAASTSASNAATSATNAATSAAAAAASVSASSFKWNLDTSTSMADPGSGEIRFNSATWASVTAVAISDNSADTGNPDVSAIVLAWDDSTNTAHRGSLTFRKATAPAEFVTFSITGASNDNVGWTQLVVTHVAGNPTWSAADSLIAVFTRTGNAGANGAGSGDLLAANNLSDLDSASTARTNLGLDASWLGGLLDEAVHAITDVASAATCDIGASATDRVRITGTTTITSLGTSANRLRFVHFDNALTLTHNATSLILPTGANIVTAASDAAIFSSDGSGNWRCLAYQRASGRAIVPAVNYATTSVASAATTDIGATATDRVSITGTTTITSLGTTANTVRFVSFVGILTLTHNATSLILPTGANIVTAAGDCAIFSSDGSGNWRCLNYTRANGTALVSATTSFATISEVQGVHTTGTVTSGTTSMTVASATGITAGMFVVGLGITPGTTVSSIVSTTVTLSQNANVTLSSRPVSFYRADLALSPGNAAGQLARAWVNFNGTGTVSIRAAYNVSSITDNAVGNYTVNFTTAMPDENYAVSGMTNDNGNLTNVCYRTGGTFTASAIQISVVQDGAVLSDSANVMVAVFR
jgi:hypothetical protein